MGNLGKPLIATVFILVSIVSPISPAVGSDSYPTVTVINDPLYNGPWRDGDRLRYSDTLSIYPEGGVAEDYRAGGKNAGKSWLYRLQVNGAAGIRFCDHATFTSDQVPFNVSLNADQSCGIYNNRRFGALSIYVNDFGVGLGDIGGEIRWTTQMGGFEYLVGQTKDNLCYRPDNSNVGHALGGVMIATCSYTFTESDVGKTWSSVTLNFGTGELSSISGEVLSSLKRFTAVSTAIITGSGIPNTVISCKFSGSFSPNPTRRTSDITINGEYIIDGKDLLK
jgi:hypothetical protein